MIKATASQLIFFFGIIVIVLLSSCSNTARNAFFVQHEGNTLKLKKEKDLIVTGGVLNTRGFTFLSDDDILVKNNRFAFQAAYSPIKYLGVFGLHSRLKIADANSPSVTYHKSHITGGGVGSYFFFEFFQRPPHKVLPGRPVKKTKILLDLYGGYTYGLLDNNYFFPPADATMNFQKFYLQGGIHWESSYWSFSYVHKWGRTNFLNGIINGQIDRRDDPALLAIVNQNNLFFQEATIRAEIKHNGFGLYTQFSFGDIIDSGFSSIPDSYIHCGVVVNINDVREYFKERKRINGER